MIENSALLYQSYLYKQIFKSVYKKNRLYLKFMSVA